MFEYHHIVRSVDLVKLAIELGNIKVLTLEVSSQESIDLLEIPEAIPNGIGILLVLL